eukprot:TRINITY_DN7773_c0_g1_i1.p1 TRINITY_DN7773_c0_g1~~TRINITY_DN7773_c0_g1_i1.p1  ORF type:complete len:1008 (+),score=189.64 TRINITY_DN7773_c0_g1_i1:39-3062(+)
MSVFKDLVAQLMQEYDLVSKDVGRLLRENDQLKDHSSQHEQQSSSLAKRNSELESELSGLRKQLQEAQKAQSYRAPVGPGPALPDSSSETLKAEAAPPPGGTCEVGVQAEMAETTSAGRRPVLGSKFATNISRSSGGGDLGERPAGKRLLTTGASRFAAAVKKVQDGDTEETRPALDLGASVGSTLASERAGKFALWAQKARERANEKYKEESEAAKTKSPVLSDDAAHAAGPGQGKYIDICIYAVTGLSKEFLESAQRCQVVARLGDRQDRVCWQPLHQSDMELPGQVNSADSASGFPLVAASWGRPDVGGRIQLSIEEDKEFGELELEVFAEGIQDRIGYCAVPLDSNRRTWELQGKVCGFLDCMVQICTPARQKLGEADGGFNDWEEFLSRPENQDRCRHLKKVFRITDTDQQFSVIMSDDLLQVLKGSARSGHFTRPLNEHTLADAITELCYIYSKVTGTDPPAQADRTISFVVFMRLMLMTDLASHASPESAAFIFSIQSVVLSSDALRTAAITEFLHQFDGVDGPEEGVAEGSYRGRNCIAFVNFCSSMCVFLSFALLGAALDNDPGAAHWVMIEVVFALVFVGEILTKIVIWGNRKFWKGPDKYWNWLDVALTGIAVFDVSLNFLPISLGSSGNMILILRGLRLARIARLAKLMRVPVLAELANLISGVVISLPWLIWVLVLLFVVIYIAALGARSTLSDIGRKVQDCGATDGIDLDNANVEEILAAGCKLHHLYFDAYCGDVFTCMMTLFRCMIGDCSTTGGRSLAMLLSDGFGLRFDIFYSLSMTITIFCLFNIFTAMFVEAVLSGLKYNDTQRKYAKLSEHAYVKSKVKELVKKVGSVVRNRRMAMGTQEDKQALFRRSVTRTLAIGDEKNHNHEDFQDQDEQMGGANELNLDETEFNFLLRHGSIRRILEELDIVVEPRSGVFDAFNTNSDGFVSMSEMVSGLLRLRGDLQKTDMVASQITLASIQRRVSEIQASALQSQAKMIAILEEAIGSSPR